MNVRASVLTEMDWKPEHHDAPELAQSSFPEAVPPQQQYQYNQGQYQQPYQPYPVQNATIKPEDGQVPGSAPFSAYSGSQLTSPAVAGAVPAAQGGAAKRKGTVCGCSVLEFVLCTIIALLSAAVIGLAAGTGVEANRANTAEDREAQLRSSLASATAASSGTGTATTTSSTATGTSFSDLDDDCSSNASGVTGTAYDAFSCESNCRLL